MSGSFGPLRSQCLFPLPFCGLLRCSTQSLPHLAPSPSQESTPGACDQAGGYTLWGHKLPQVLVFSPACPISWLYAASRCHRVAPNSSMRACSLPSGPPFNLGVSGLCLESRMYGRFFPYTPSSVLFPLVFTGSFSAHCSDLPQAALVFPWVV